MGGKPMTKSELSSYIAEKTGVTKRTATAMLDELATIVCSEARDSKQFTIPGIGKLVLDNRKARMGRNPATGEEIEIPAKTVVKFRVAKACKDAILGSVPSS